MSEPLINISRKQAYCFAAAFVFFEFLTYISNDMIMPAMLQVTQAFHAPSTAVASSLTAYMLGGASLQLILGPLSDAIGRRPVMITGALLFFILTILLGCSQSISQFLIGRFLQGMGLCFIIIGYATIQELFAEMDAVRLIALLANTSTIAPLLGPLAGAIFILHYPWRGIYVLVALSTLCCLYGLWRFMPETVSTHKKTPFTPDVIKRNYLALLINKRLVIGIFGLGFLSTPCIAWIGISPLILIAQAHLSVTTYALWQMPLFTACIVGNFFLRWLTHRFTLKQIITIGSGLVVTGLLLMFLLPFILAPTYLFFMPGLTLYGFGLGTTAGPLTRYLLFITPVSKGTTNAFINTLDMLIMGGCTEIANILYQTQNNLYFGGYMAMCGVVYLCLISLIGLNSHESIKND